MQLGGNGALSNTVGKSVKTLPIVASTCMVHFVRYGCCLQLMGYLIKENVTFAQVLAQLMFFNCILTNISNGVGQGTGNYGHYGTLYKFSWNYAGVSYIAFGLLILLFVILFI